MRLYFFIFALLAGCMQANDTFKPVDSVGAARKIADSRFAAQAQMLGLNLTKVPEPTVEERESDFQFVYSVDGKKEKITVIVGRDGGVSDTHN